MNYTISLFSPYFDLHFDPRKLPGMPPELPVSVMEVMEVLSKTTKYWNSALITERTNPHSHPARPNVFANAELFRDHVVAKGVQAIKDYCIVRVTPQPHGAPAEPRVATSQAGDTSAIHTNALHQIQFKLQTLQTEVNEALAALDAQLGDPQGPGYDYWVLSDDRSVVEALCLLGRLDPNALSTPDGLFRVFDILSPEQREALQTITHELRNVDDGLGHATVDSTGAGLIREHEGATAGDRHEQLMAKVQEQVAAMPRDIPTDGFRVGC